MIQIDISAYFLAALLLLLIPMDWLFSASLAALFHELCHILSVYILGGRIRGIRIGINGAVIDADRLDKGKVLLCTIAGPFGNLLLLQLCHIFPKIAICSAIQAAVNLLPIWPLDGGRILKCFLELMLPFETDKIMRWIERIVLFAILFFAFFISKKGSLGIAPILASLLLILKAISRKRPCKRS